MTIKEVKENLKQKQAGIKLEIMLANQCSNFVTFHGHRLHKNICITSNKHDSEKLPQG